MGREGEDTFQFFEHFSIFPVSPSPYLPIIHENILIFKNKTCFVS